MIGDVQCSVTSATATQITCAAGQNPIGTYNLTLSVLGKGSAIINNPQTLSFQLTASSMSPLIGTIGGGNLLAINGTGFISSCVVTVDGNNCVVVNATYSLITCIVPSNVIQLNSFSLCDI